ETRDGCRIYNQWQGGERRGGARHGAALGGARASETHRHEVRVRGGPLRRLYGPYRRQGRALSCQTAMSAVGGKTVTTIEGLSPNSSHPLQKAWIAEQVPQCGYCQSGQIMQAAELLAKTKKPTRKRIVAHMDGNICRCGTYPRIVRAIERAAREA